ncbi:hypothetical protein G6F31_017802 [Rhizopus arrhizus]|nr:hypothetical protein G6F31_017802 [Rhizopus arrhizus]
MPSQESLHSAHIREIEQVGRGRPTQRDAHVVRSWLRCLDQYQLDPAQACEAYIVPDGRLREHRQQSEALINIARSGLDHLFKQVAGQNYVLLLADRQGRACTWGLNGPNRAPALAPWAPAWKPAKR